MTRGYDPQLIFEKLHVARVRYVIIGGWAVNAHGHRRFTGDVDICPDPDFDNLSRLADLLAGLNAQQLELEEFDPAELPGDPTDPASLAGGQRVGQRISTISQRWRPWRPEREAMARCPGTRFSSWAAAGATLDC